ncbi:hypothetical protein M3Y97_00017800 [Aphelenchoides bicaudatus]|nr:hypothetical protein M3Y97_00017800 [Aphelenchoides bicaudatus]
MKWFIPLYSLPFVVYGFSLGALITLRSSLYIISNQLGTKLPPAPYYAALWTIPVMSLIHAILGGFIYQMFSNLTVFTALFSNSIHLALEGRKSVLEMVKHIATSAETLMLVVVHLLLFWIRNVRNVLYTATRPN